MSFLLTADTKHPAEQDLISAGYHQLPTQDIQRLCWAYDRDEVVGSCVSAIISGLISGGVHSWVGENKDLLKSNYRAHDRWIRFIRSMIRWRYCAGFIAAIIANEDDDETVIQKEGTIDGVKTKRKGDPAKIIKRCQPLCLDLTDVMTYFRMDITGRTDFHFFEVLTEPGKQGYDLRRIENVHVFSVADNELPTRYGAIRSKLNKCAHLIHRELINEAQAIRANEWRSRVVLISEKVPESSNQPIAAAVAPPPPTSQPITHVHTHLHSSGNADVGAQGGRSSGEFARDVNNPDKDQYAAVNVNRQQASSEQAPAHQVYLAPNRKHITHPMPEAPANEDADRRNRELRIYMAFDVPPAILQAWSVYLTSSTTSKSRTTDVSATKVNSAMQLFLDVLNTDRTAYEQFCTMIINSAVRFEEADDIDGLIQITLPGKPDLSTITTLYEQGVLTYEAYKDYLESIFHIPLEQLHKKEPDMIKVVREGEPVEPAAKKAKT